LYDLTIIIFYDERLQKHSSNIALAFIPEDNISLSDYSLAIVEIVNGAKNSTKQCSLRTNLWRGEII
jgi:hypothetical protein